MVTIMKAKEARSTADFVHSMDVEVEVINYIIRTEAEKGNYSASIDLSKFDKNKIIPLINLMRAAEFSVIYNQTEQMADVRWDEKEW